jgi:hypothetical protein
VNAFQIDVVDIDTVVIFDMLVSGIFSYGVSLRNNLSFMSDRSNTMYVFRVVRESVMSERSSGVDEDRVRVVSTIPSKVSIQTMLHPLTKTLALVCHWSRRH